MRPKYGLDMRPKERIILPINSPQGGEMQFRERRRVIQVIRSVYDPRIKRGRAEVVGGIDRDNPVLDEGLRAICTTDELEEVEVFLELLRHRQSRESAREAAADLPAQMRLAETWFRERQTDEAGPLAAEVWTAWEDLAKALHKAGIGKSKHRS